MIFRFRSIKITVSLLFIFSLCLVPIFTPLHAEAAYQSDANIVSLKTSMGSSSGQRIVIFPAAVSLTRWWRRFNRG